MQIIFTYKYWSSNVTLSPDWLRLVNLENRITTFEPRIRYLQLITVLKQLKLHCFMLILCTALIELFIFRFSLLYADVVVVRLCRARDNVNTTGKEDERQEKGRQRLKDCEQTLDHEEVWWLPS